MYSIVHTAVLCGIEARKVAVEADISNGMPVFEMVGFLSSEVKEAKDRVRTALKNCGYELPVKRITVNLSPANIRKSGSGFDLAVAVAVLSAMEIVPKTALHQIMMVGEISLEGRITGISGVLPMVLCAKAEGIGICLVAKENAHEASLVPGMQVIGVRHLQEVIGFLQTGNYNASQPDAAESGRRCVTSDQRDWEEAGASIQEKDTQKQYDFSQINGQQLLKRACEVAISGMHNLLMVGPPGAGKTMIARCIPSILPEMSVEEQLELSKIYSVCGLFQERDGLMDQRPFRSPHHTITEQGLIGGGAIVHPGEISLAHGGVLFLDELTEFKKSTLEVLRQPLEDKCVCLARVSGTYCFPADFVLVAAMNPCNCGYYPDLSRCHCTSQSLQRYHNKLSRPLLDRIDLCVEAAAVGYEELRKPDPANETSAQIRQRVVAMHALQKARFAGTGIRFNSRIPAVRLEQYCPLGSKEEHFMKNIYERMGLTARTYHKIIRVARTIADMDGSRDIECRHLQEAVCYRSIEQNDWENGL